MPAVLSFIPNIFTIARVTTISENTVRTAAMLGIKVLK